MSERLPSFRERLATLDRQGRSLLRGARARDGFTAACHSAVPVLLASALAFLVLRVGGLFPRGAGGSMSGWWAAALLLVPFACAVGARLLRDAWRPIAAGEGLALADHQLGLSDRLQTAQSFLQHTEPTPFMRAAIEDARVHTDRAEAAELALPPERERQAMGPSAWLPGVGALVLVLLGLVVPGYLASRSANEAPVAPGEEIALADPEAATLRGEPPAAQDPVPPETPREGPRQERAAQPDASTEGDQQGDEVKTSAGKTQAGMASDAGAPTDATEARSAPTEQGQAAEGGRRPKPSAPRPKKPEPEASEEAEPLERAEKSGATTGRSASQGSTKNPSVNAWSSKDAVPSSDEEPGAEEDDVEDESDASEARGGMQPTLRDRKPPVNRDLGVGFGNRQDPDANGRGGPSQRKKSRGTASLILGVPIPDHIKGMTNRGRTKVTQERVEPTEESPTTLPADARTPRADSAGRLRPFDLTPWMRRLVRDVFQRSPPPKGSE